MATLMGHKENIDSRRHKTIFHTKKKGKYIKQPSKANFKTLSLLIENPPVQLLFEHLTPLRLSRQA